MKSVRRSGFTLIELLTVMAITAILLTIISVPLVQGFNLTRVGQGFSQAQDRARLIIEQVQRDIGNGVSVRDNSGIRGSILVEVPGRNGQYESLLLPNAKIDILMPSRGEPLRGPGGALLNPNLLRDPNGDPNDPTNWREDPTLRTPVGQPTFPAAGGYRLVRYFIGLREPILGTEAAPVAGRYINPFDRILNSPQGTENLYVLYRAEIDYRRWRPDPNNPQNGQWVYNNALFDIRDGRPVLDDPSFFSLPADPNADPRPGTPEFQAKVARIRAWQRQSRIVSNFSRIDLIQPVYDRGSFQAIYDGNVPRILPLVQFRPTRVTSEPAEGSVVARTNEEFEGSEKSGSDVFRTKYGGWTQSTLRYWPSQIDPFNPQSVQQPWVDGTPYMVARQRLLNPQTLQSEISLFRVDDRSQEANGGIEFFDVSGYVRARSLDPQTVAANDPLRYPFSFGIAQANLRSGFLNQPFNRTLFAPIAIDPRTGQVTTSFDIIEIGGDGNRTTPAGFPNLPSALIGSAVAPSQTTLGTNTTDWTRPEALPSSPTSEVNTRFNALYNAWDRLVPGLSKSACRRFIDLRFVRAFDGSPSPLHPTLGFPRARIVPGSEMVFGPDQKEGPNKGRPIRYSRVVAGASGNVVIGPNQYFINYVHRPDALTETYEELGFNGVSRDPSVYDPTNFASAVLQSRFRAGYLELNSDPNSPIPPGNITVQYRFQFNESSDVIAVDYDTRQVIDVNLTLRQFPGTAAPNPQSITLRGTATVRNSSR